jgi:hypothetical protein
VERDEFWRLVEEARVGIADTASTDGAGEVARRLADRLGRMGPAAAIEFHLAMDDVVGDGYRWDLWAAAYLMRSGCGDDGFEYFRRWLVAQGREAWDRALADPDSLVGYGVDPEGLFSCEEVGTAAVDAYEQLTGDPEAFWEELERLAGEQPAPVRVPVGPAGEEFDFDDAAQMRARFPRLAALHLGDAHD